MADDDPLDITLDTSNVRDVLAAVKEASPALARRLRKRLRGTGDAIIAQQRAVLDGPLPGNAAKSGTRLKLVAAKDGRKAYVQRVNVYKDVATKRRRGRGMREQIKGSLTTRVMTGKSRQGVAVRAQTRIGGVMAIQWQARRFRHPVFGTGQHVDQKGQPYFWEPAVQGAAQARTEIAHAIDEALDEISN